MFKFGKEVFKEKGCQQKPFYYQINCVHLKWLDKNKEPVCLQHNIFASQR